ncbi:hypothetical protein ASPCAL00417 [Aspergillus calidoustus]|uniref:Transposase MuDR plant domain-containing protein n=1 Tax=Aspergillus calidoustus TaxID=454130 RepID=A0A0U4YVF9_ASPCI|nr:hypothetical protein ASPCAL00417 [Aspergillus calidoustus]
MTEIYSGLHVGQRFSSLEDFKGVVRSISVRQHWELRVTRSNKKSVVIGCRSSNSCFFRVVCRANRNATYISSLQDSHSCRRNATSTTKTPARSEASHVRFLLNEIPKLFDMEKEEVKAQKIVDRVKRYHGYDISTRQAQRALIRLQQRGSQNQSDAANSSSGEGEDRQESQPPTTVEGQTESPAFSGMPGQRWVPESAQPSQMEGIQQQPPPPQTEGVHNPTLQAPPLHGQPAQPQPIQSTPQLQHLQRVRPSIQGQPQQSLPPPTPPIQPPAVLNHEAVSMNHTLHPQPNAQPPSFPHHSPSQPLPQQPVRPRSPTQTPQNGHPSAPQLVLTNFKIEFTCTTCGSLNQSFFPNQGHVTGGHYMPPRPAHDHAVIPAGAGPPVPVGTAQGSAEGAAERMNEAHRYDRARMANVHGAPTGWAPAGVVPLDVPMAPPHTQHSPT